MQFPPIFLHYLDRELVSGVGFKSTALYVENITQCLLLATTSPLYCALSLIWESPVSVGDITEFVSRLVCQGHLDLFSRFHSLDGFLESKRLTYIHDKRRYPMYFLEKLPNGLRIEPTHWKDCSTTEAISEKLFDWAVRGESPKIKVNFQQELPLIFSLKKIVIDSLNNRNGRAITFPLFAKRLQAKSLGEVGATVLRRQLLVNYCEHYLEFAHGSIPTGIRGLNFFDQMGTLFPFYDVPILQEVIRLAGLGALCSGQWNNSKHVFLELRNCEMHIEFVRLLNLFLAGVLGVSELSLGCNSSYANRAIIIQNIRRILSAKDKKQTARNTVEDYLSGATDYLGNTLRRASVNPLFNNAKEKIQMQSDDNKVDILIVTATTVETETVIAAFKKETGYNFERKFVDDHTYYRLGVVAGCTTFLVQSEMGSGGPSGSLFTISDAIKVLQPSFIIMAGIAFGLKHGKQQIGDILVSKQVLSYELQRVNSSGKRRRVARGDRVQATPLLLDRFRSGVVDWKKANIHFGLIMSGEKLVDSQSFIKELLDIEPEAIGGEMEGAGLYAASTKFYVPWILIKGICDWADGSKNDQFQKIAIENTVDFILHVIRQGALSIPI